MSHNVLDFGNTTEDWNRALAEGGDVYFPAGNYWVGTSLHVGSGTRVHGAGSATVIHQARESRNHLLRLDGSGITIEDLSINGSEGLGGHGIAVAGQNATDILLRNLDVSAISSDGISLAATISQNVRVMDCTVRGCGLAGITVRSGTAINCKFIGNTVSNTREMNLGVTAQVQNMVIAENILDGTGIADNITCYGRDRSNIIISNNLCSNGGINGIHVGAERVTVTGNQIESPTKYGIQLVNTNHPAKSYVCTDNIILDVKTHSGIWVQELDLGVISGNVINQIAQHGIWLKNCRKVRVAGNVIDNVGGQSVTTTLDCSTCVIENNLS